MTYCIRCGTSYPDGTKTCPKCGAPLEYASEAQRGGVVMPTGRAIFYDDPAPQLAYIPSRGNASPAPVVSRPVNGTAEHGEAGMLKLSDIKKDYKVASSYVHALKGVSLEFRKSEFVCILGQSGCGKTTLLNIIGGLDQYTSGDLVIQGKSTKKYRDRDWDIYRNHRIGFIFQSYNLIPHQTVLGNVELALTIAGMDKGERKRRAKEALERVGLSKELHKRPNQLSGGQMQRVAIARALVNDPDILLADEPTGALDSKTSVEVMELIKEIAKEKLVIMVTHNGELAEEYASRIVRLKDGLVESDSNPYIGDQPSEKAAESVKKEKKHGKHPRAKMSFLTSLALSFQNLLTKKGRTIITSVAGSIGIISVCLVLALSSGFQTYIRHTEEDMLSYYPLHISESTLDITSIMSAMNSPADMPKLSEIGDKVYVNSFLTGLAQGIAVQNNISEEYVDYLEKGRTEHSDWFSAIQYDYGYSVGDYLFTNVTVGGIEVEGEMLPEEERNFSVTRLKEFFIQELMTKASQYQQLLGYVNLFTNVINKLPGTADFEANDYGKYVLSQYDVVAGHFPENEHEAVLVVGSNNELIDLTLVQLGFMTEAQFIDLFIRGEELMEENEVRTTSIALTADGGTMSEDDGSTFISYDRIFEQEYALLYNNAVYEKNESFFTEEGLMGAFRKSSDGTYVQADYPFEYRGERADMNIAAEDGIDFKITGILRLKENFTYGCLSDGLNLPEGTINAYIERNMQSSELLEFIRESALTFGEGEEAVTMWAIPPAANLASYYTIPRNFSIVDFMPELAGTPFEDLVFTVNFAYNDGAIRSVGGNDLANNIYIYPANFDAKENVLSYLDAWNDMCEAEGREGDVIKYNDTVGLLMGMMQTMLNVITYVLVAFTAISLVVSSVMIGIITYVSVVERVKEIGVLRSLGARKKDIRNLFNAETFIIGLAAGLIGISVTYFLAAIVSAIIYSLSGIAGIATLPPLTAFIMVCVSVLLTLISGLIPAQAAARKDPVIALRTE